MGIRPQSLRLVDPDEARLPCTVDLVERLGEETVISAKLASGKLVLANIAGDAAIKTGHRIGLTFDTAKAHLFRESGPRLDTRVPEPA